MPPYPCFEKCGDTCPGCPFPYSPRLCKGTTHCTFENVNFGVGGLESSSNENEVL
jgi:hypothetical protein